MGALFLIVGTRAVEAHPERGSALIEARHLTRRFGSFVALDDMSFEVARGRVVGFLGLNGAGKTTTMRIVSCYLPPTSGSVRVGGFDTVRQSDSARRLLGYLPERVPLYEDLRVQEYLRFRAALKGVKGSATQAAVESVVSRCGLETKRKAVVGTLSKGYRQRVGIADALIHNPALLILDEPTSGLDPDQRIELRHLIRALGEDRTVLVSTHILSEAEATCDDVIIVHRGQVRCVDTLENLRSAQGSGFRVRHGGPPLERYRASVTSVAEDQGHTVVICPEQAVASQLVDEVVTAGRPLLEMQSQSPSLEEIFISLTTGREDFK